MASKTNCEINGIKYHRIRRKVGMKFDKRGKLVPDIKPFYGKNKKDAENQYAEFLKNQKSGVKNDKEYLIKVLNYWVYEVFYKGNHAPGTKEKYECAYRLYVKNSSLNGYLMSEISSKPVQEFFNSLDASFSQTSAVKKMLSLFFKYAELEGYCRNPMPNVTIKKSDKVQSEIVVFNKREVKKILKSESDSRNSTYRVMFILALGTGLRQGELLGLKYSDIKDGKIKVMRQIVTDTDKVRKEDNTKSHNGVRYVPIPESILKELEEHKKHRINDYVFCTASGKLIDKSNLISSWKRFLKSIGVDYKEFHTLRRTYCTMLCENGVPLQDASRLMGHSSVAVTARYYTFVSDKAKENAAAKLNKAFEAKLPTKSKPIKKKKYYVVKKWLKRIKKS